MLCANESHCSLSFLYRQHNDYQYLSEVSQAIQLLLVVNLYHEEVTFQSEPPLYRSFLVGCKQHVNEHSAGKQKDPRRSICVNNSKNWWCRLLHPHLRP